MAGLQIFYHPEVVRKDIPRLDPPTRQRIKSAIESKLASRPEEFGKPLAYNKAGIWSLRVGDWRVLFTMQSEELWILRIGHRREVYDALGREVPGGA